MNSGEQIIIRKTWRSEFIGVGLFVFLSIVAVFLSRSFPWSVIEGELISLFGYSVYLKLPLFWFIPALTIATSLYRIYDVRYIIDARGIESERGIISLHRRTTRLWFEDVRSVQTSQGIVDRALDIGNVDIGTAATGTVEISMKGIGAPHEVQEMVQRERDERQRAERRMAESSKPALEAPVFA